MSHNGTALHPPECPLVFDAEAHRYSTHAGEVWPSVTQVLEPYSGLEMVPRHYLEHRAALGKAVHETVALYLADELDEAALDDTLRDYLSGFVRFLDESGFVPTASEVMVWHPKMRYAGTLDLLGQFPRRGGQSLLDLKISEALPKTVGPQTAAYAEAYSQCHMGGRPNLFSRYCLRLGVDSYRLDPLTNPTDFSVFLAALTLHRWRNS